MTTSKEISELDLATALLATDEFPLNRPTDTSQALTGTNFRVARNDLVTFPIIHDDGTTIRSITEASGFGNQLIFTAEDNSTSAYAQAIAACGPGGALFNIFSTDNNGHAISQQFGSLGGPSGYTLIVDGLTTIDMTKESFAFNADDGTTLHEITAVDNQLTLRSGDDATGANVQIAMGAGPNAGLSAFSVNDRLGGVAQWGLAADAGLGTLFAAVDGLTALSLHKADFALNADDGTATYAFQTEVGFGRGLLQTATDIATGAKASQASAVVPNEAIWDMVAEDGNGHSAAVLLGAGTAAYPGFDVQLNGASYVTAGGAARTLVLGDGGDGLYILNTLPTSDPHVVGKAWRSGTALQVSLG